MNITINESAWQFAVNKANASAQSTHDAAQALKPEKDRVSFVPVTVNDYAQARIAEIEASYVAQEQEEFNRLITASTPEDKARIAKILSLPEQAKEGFRAQVDALSA